jgi:hypothetical protein
VFTQAEPNGWLSKTKGYGDKFATFIVENNLGTVVQSQRRTNPNSSNPGKLFLWTLNHAALDKFFREHVVDQIKQVGTGPLRLER